MIAKLQILIVSCTLKLFLNFVFITCTWRVINKNVFLDLVRSNRPVLLCGWHSRLLFVARFFKNSSFEPWAISSSHRDSEIMAKILTKWNWKLIKGSSTRGWSNVIKKMMVLLKKPSTIIAITNDGPKGPAKQAKKGSIDLAIRNNAHILSISCHATNFWNLKSWDKTMIPKPFSTIYVKFDKPISPQKITNCDQSEMVTNYLNANLNQLKNEVGGST